MPPKGVVNNPNGRPKGAKSLVAEKARAIIVEFINQRADNIDKWMEEVYQRDGANEALKVYMGLLEFALPKLSRQDIVVEGTINHAVESLSRGRDRLHAGELASLPVPDAEYSEVPLASVASTDDK